MKTKAFTLIELLVVVLILGLLTTIVVGVFTTQVERARYAPTPPDLTLVTDDVTTVRSAMLHRLDRRRRARATLAPASLRTAREDARV